MEQTTNYALKKPSSDDFYSVNDQNGNMDIIDEELKKVSDVANSASSSASNHASDKSNPHEVTKTQVGLGNVPNVSTNNQTPTYTLPDAVQELSSGEKLSVAFGKIAKAIKQFISDISSLKSGKADKATTLAGYGITDAASSSHNHNGVYQPVGNYAASNHNHSGVYQPVGNYAASNHNHDGTYAASSHTHSQYLTGINKSMVTTALGYTPPTQDTNTWRPLGTGASDACAGNDSRLSNARPASDVYSWAKQSSKPSYSWGEISDKPSIPSSGGCGFINVGSLLGENSDEITRYDDTTWSVMTAGAYSVNAYVMFSAVGDVRYSATCIEVYINDVILAQYIEKNGGESNWNGSMIPSCVPLQAGQVFKIRYRGNAKVTYRAFAMQ